MNTEESTRAPSTMNILWWSLGPTDTSHYAQRQRLALETLMDSDGDFGWFTSQLLVSYLTHKPLGKEQLKQ